MYHVIKSAQEIFGAFALNDDIGSGGGTVGEFDPDSFSKTFGCGISSTETWRRINGTGH